MEWVYVAADMTTVKLHHSLGFVADQAYDFINVFTLPNPSDAQVTGKPSATNRPIFCRLNRVFKYFRLKPIAFLVNASITYFTINYGVQVIEIGQKATCTAKIDFSLVLRN